jgi:hypothetical protein
MITKCVKLGAKHYIKENLQKYLPDGYYNPLRVNRIESSSLTVCQLL